TPVSAYLHSATMANAGVFLIARLYPVLGGTSLFMYVIATVGLVTFVFGAYVAVFKHDLKGLLAYSTMSHLGLITFLIGLDSPLSIVAASAMAGVPLLNGFLSKEMFFAEALELRHLGVLGVVTPAAVAVGGA